jgi:hypothetical protein
MHEASLEEIERFHAVDLSPPATGPLARSLTARAHDGVTISRTLC